LPRALPARYVPPSGFGHPLDGFLPSIPRRFSFTPAALMGFTLRSFLLPESRRSVSASTHPLTVSSRRCNHLPKQEARICGPRFLGLSSRKSLATGRVFSTSTAGGSLGVSPSRVLSRRPLPGFRPASSHTLHRTAVSRDTTGVPEFRSAVACLRSSSRVQARGGVRRDPPRVSAPVQSQHWDPLRLWLSFSPHAASFIAADRPAIFETWAKSYRSCRESGNHDQRSWF
jgi:hypothetical protein